MHPRGRRSSVVGQGGGAHGQRPRTPLSTPSDPHADLDLLLAESDRDERFLSPAPRPDAPHGEASIDDQILAGLVSP